MEKEKMKVLQEQIEELAAILERNKIKEYMHLMHSPWRLIYLNFMIGLARGLGMAIGLTILAAAVIYILKSWVNLPLIGQYIAKLLDIIQNYR